MTNVMPRPGFYQLSSAKVLSGDNGDEFFMENPSFLFLVPDDKTDSGRCAESQAHRKDDPNNIGVIVFAAAICIRRCCSIFGVITGVIGAARFFRAARIIARQQITANIALVIIVAVDMIFPCDCRHTFGRKSVGTAIHFSKSVGKSVGRPFVPYYLELPRSKTLRHVGVFSRTPLLKIHGYFRKRNESLRQSYVPEG